MENAQSRYLVRFQTFRVTRGNDKLILRQWTDGPMSCSCNEVKCPPELLALALLAYWVVSTGSRVLFPPRNLIPIP